jgi:hypothetical protein
LNLCGLPNLCALNPCGRRWAGLRGTRRCWPRCVRLPIEWGLCYAWRLGIRVAWPVGHSEQEASPAGRVEVSDGAGAKVPTDGPRRAVALA